MLDSFNPESEAGKATKVLDGIRQRLIETDRQLAESETALQSVEAEASDVVLEEVKFAKAAEKVGKAQTRVTALRGLRRRIESELPLAARVVAAAKLADLRAECDARQGELDAIHRQAREHLDKLAVLMGVQFYPLTVLYAATPVPDDRSTLNPNFAPAYHVSPDPKTAMMIKELNELRLRVIHAEVPDALEAEAQRLLQLE